MIPQINIKRTSYRLIHLFFILLYASYFVSQSPSYSTLGEEELSGIEIYDIHQDEGDVLWLATDNGLIKYDGYTFENIVCRGALGNSIFNLKTDYNNVLYGMNLSGQIFQIKDNTCSVYYKVPDSLMFKDLSYCFDDKNDLVIATRSFFKVNKDKNLKIFKKESTFSNLQTLKDNTIQIYDHNNSQLIRLKNNTTSEISINNDTAIIFINLFNYNEQSYAYDPLTGQLLMIKNNHLVKEFEFNLNDNNDKNILRFYPNNEDLVVAKQSGGVNVLDKNLVNNYATLFPNQLISTVCKDRSGSYLFGTFGNGILVVPNLDLVDVKVANNEHKYTRITATAGGTLLLGTQSGSVYKVDTNLQAEILWNQKSKNVEILEYFSQCNSVLVDGKEATFVNLTTKAEKEFRLGAIKDISKYYNEYTYLVAFNSGVYTLEIEDSVKVFTPIDDFKGRTNCISYDSANSTIYAGTVLGLRIGNNEGTRLFNIDQKSIVCSDILYYKKRMFITTKKMGLLVFENNKLIDRWNLNSGFITNELDEIKVHRGLLYITSDLGLIISSLEGEVVSLINKSEGLRSNKIIDFEFVNDDLWLIHQKGIQRINTNKITVFDFKPRISIKKLVVNDSIISSVADNEYNYLQNKIEFHISATSLKYQDEITYSYQLIGIDNEWQNNTYLDNKILYKSLPSGSYTFIVKSKCRGVASEELSYSFTINPPFWETWWFYMLILLLFISITFLIYKREIKKQKKKIQLKNELNASKLIAIQSQMNPHFIFNAINSIQDLILKEDVDNSYRYIIKFSKLVRQTLNFSDKEFIDIEEEIELLKIYLELEKLRFKKDFEYTIICEDIDLLVPPMLVQPFVENAIKHGLLHRAGLKKLTITFTKEDILQCTVVDNGIGREKAQKIKERQKKNHKSFSVNATQTRFEIMKSQYQQDLGVRFEDLRENGEAQGTKVIIKMPFKDKY